MTRDFSPQELDDFERSPRESDIRSKNREPQRPDLKKSLRSPHDHAHTPEHPEQDQHSQTPFRNGRQFLYDRDRTYQLSDSEIRSIVELGKFRVIGTRDLADHAYSGRREQAARDLHKLLRQGLVRKGIFEGADAHPRELLTLTKRGHQLLCGNQLAPEGQATHYDFVKPREANHDADLYLLYQREAARIEAQGGRNLRVILDYELKRKINREFAKLGTEARNEIAARHGLEVVRNKIPVPDLRIEYETRDGDMARVNLELVTEHYRGRQVADKVRAGFSLYTPHGEADRLRRVLDQRELTADILSL